MPPFSPSPTPSPGSRLWLWFAAAFLVQAVAWTAWFTIAARHPVAEVPLIPAGTPSAQRATPNAERPTPSIQESQTDSPSSSLSVKR